LYEFAIAVGLKHRRPTALHAASLGGVAPAPMKTHSLMSGCGPPLAEATLCPVPGPIAAAPISSARTLIAASLI